MCHPDEGWWGYPRNFADKESPLPYRRHGAEQSIGELISSLLARDCEAGGPSFAGGSASRNPELQHPKLYQAAPSLSTTGDNIEDLINNLTVGLAFSQVTANQFSDTKKESSFAFYPISFKELLQGSLILRLRQHGSRQ